MSDTPRTDSLLTAILDADGFVDHSNCPQRWVDHSRQLERELNAANERIKHLRDGIAKQNQTIEQACGKVLGYPWFKDDQKNFPGSTEKDGVCVGEHVAETIVCELVGKHMEALAHIKRLEEAGDALYENSYPTRWDLPEANARKLKEQEAWLKAKEAKP